MLGTSVLGHRLGIENNRSTQIRTRGTSQASRKAICLLLILVMGAPALLAAAVRKGEALYVGGTVSLPELTKGTFDTRDKESLVFNSAGGNFHIPYQNITSLEYGQKAGRRVGVAIVISVWALFSKKRKHILTIGWKDEAGEPQGVVVEVPKGTAKTFITIVETRSGVEVEYESEEARNHVHG